MKKSNSVIYSGLMIALVFIGTFLIKIPVPMTQGYIHPGDSMIFVAGILFGWKTGMLAGGIGSAMADLVGGYAVYAFPTLIIKGIMGLIVGFISEETRKNKKIKFSVSLISSAVWIIFGLILKTILNSNSGNLSVMNQLEVSPEKFSEMIKNTGNVLLYTMIIIPVVIMVISLILRKKDFELFSFSNLIGTTIAGLWMVIGYYTAEIIIYGNPVIPIFSIGFNIIQFVSGIIISYIIVIAMKKVKAI
ncbi:MAG: ECF transporter S component [Thermotogae bacterium]|nr:ECF transporter S component [Thermotogota bacterium]MCP5465078.1 ECF transporter S component [Thermotogota bacterium]